MLTFIFLGAIGMLAIAGIFISMQAKRRGKVMPAQTPHGGRPTSRVSGGDD